VSGDASILAGAALTDFSVPNEYQSSANFRCFVLDTGANVGKVAAPSAGGDIHGVVRHPGQAFLAFPGRPLRIEASASFSAGASLVVGTDGRVATGSGITVAIALEASSGAGSIVWCRIPTGR